MRITRRYLACCTRRITSTTMVFSIFALVTLPISSVRSPRSDPAVACVAAVVCVSAVIPVLYAFAFFDFRDRGTAELFCALTAAAAATCACDAVDNSCARNSVFTRAKSFLDSRKRFSASACPVDNWKRSRKIVSLSSFCCAASSLTPASRIFSIRRGILEFSCAGNEFGWNRQLVRSQSQRCARRDFIDPGHFKHDATGLYHRNPLFRSAFTFAHAGFRGLLGKWLIRKNSDPKFAAALDKSRNGHAGSFNLAIGNPGIFHGLESVFAKRQRTAAPGFAFAAAAHLLSVFHLLGHQHRYILASLYSTKFFQSAATAAGFSCGRVLRFGTFSP